MFATPWDLVSLRRGCVGGDDPAGNHRATPWNLVSQKSLRCLHDDSCAARSSCTSPSRRNCGVAPNRRNCGVALRALQKNLWCASCLTPAHPLRFIMPNERVPTCELISGKIRSPEMIRGWDGMMACRSGAG